MAAGAGARTALEAGSDLTGVLELVWDWLAAAPGPVGRALRLARRALRPRLPHVAADGIFPLPFAGCPPPRSYSRGARRTAADLLLNLWVAFLNVAYAGPLSEHVCPWEPSAAQARCLGSLRSRATAFVGQVGSRPLGSLGSIRHLLRLGKDNYDALAPVLPLGARAGVPERAGRVDTEAVLRDHLPSLAEKARSPEALLNDPLVWGDAGPPHAAALLSNSYPEYIRKGVDAGLFEWMAEEDLAEVCGTKVVSGAFAVPKDEHEDRGISPLERLNSLVSDDKLEAVCYPYLPQLATVTVPRSSRILISKRDARHYYPS